LALFLAANNSSRIRGNKPFRTDVRTK
jgi:hypothetical protein